MATVAFTLMSTEVSAFPFKEKEPKNVTTLKFAKVMEGSKLIIKDHLGLVIYKETIQESGAYAKGFDLTALPNGAYFFELESEMEIVVIPFEVKAAEVTFDKEHKETIFKPVVRVKDEKVFVSRTSFEEATLEYKLYYVESSDVVLNEKHENEKVVERVYDFSEAKKGEYVFVFKSNGRKYIRPFKI